MDFKEAKSKLEFDKIVTRINNLCYSTLGKSICDEFPFYFTVEEVKKELQKTEEMKDLLLLGEAIELEELKDINELIYKLRIQGNFISGENFLKILNFLRISRKLKNSIKNLSNEYQGKYLLIRNITDNLFADKVLEHNIETVIDEEGNIKETASKELKKIRDEIKSRTDRLRKSLLKILKNVSEAEMTRDEIVTLRDGRSVIPVKVESKRRVPGIIHSASASGATVFIEPQETIDINNEITELKFEEKREVERILLVLSEKVSNFSEQLIINGNILSEIDFIQAKAKYASEIEGNIPEISENEISLVNAYHPVLMQTHRKDEIVALNLNIGNNFNTLIVTGPNAGGKTVALKTVGLLNIMFQSGLLIPVHPSSKIRIFEKFFVSIGDEQSIENNLSSFSSHLKSIKNILDNCNNKSLILIDEICSGTDPTFGGALSAAILKDFSDKGSYSIVTTHIGTLKSFAYNMETMENASLEFDINTLSPNYKFVTGIPGQSFTFEIANKFNFPVSILNYAKELTGSRENSLEDLIKELNEDKQKYTDLKRNYDIQNIKLSGLINLYNEKTKEIKSKERVIINTAKKDAQKLLDEGRKLLEKAIKEVRENKDFKPKEIKYNFEKSIKDITKIEPAKTEILKVREEIKINDYVKIIESNTTGQVIEIKHNNASVNSNGLIIKIKIDKLEKIKKREQENIYKSGSKFDYDTEPFIPRLDLRGCFKEEIKDKLDKFIYDAHINSLYELTIVHGKGSGVLREVVQKYMKSNSMIASYRFGNWNEGDSGVTIVELKNPNKNEQDINS